LLQPQQLLHLPPVLLLLLLLMLLRKLVGGRLLVTAVTVATEAVVRVGRRGVSPHFSATRQCAAKLTLWRRRSKVMERATVALGAPVGAAAGAKKMRLGISCEGCCLQRRVLLLMLPLEMRRRRHHLR
jgi:hypothetical protein